MKREGIAFFVFLVLLLLSIPFESDVATSLLPGWHVEIYPPCCIAAIILFFVTAGYWILLKRAVRMNPILFVTHVLLSIPTVVFIRLPFLFVHFQAIKNVEDYGELFNKRMTMLECAFSLFILGQLLFGVFFLLKLKQVLKS